MPSNKPPIDITEIEEIDVTVVRVRIPARSGMGYGEGWTRHAGRLFQVTWVGSRGPMVRLGRAVYATAPGDEPVVAMVPLHAIQSVQPIKEGFA